MARPLEQAFSGAEVARVPLPRRALPQRPADGHKGTFGTVLCVAGSPGMLGAGILVARAALRSGAGLVRAVLDAELCAPLTVAVPPATTLTVAQLGAACEGADAIVCGPGLPPERARQHLATIRAAAPAVPLVLDAGALDPQLVADAPLGPHVVLTPHPGEAARLLGTTAAAVQADRETAVATLVARTGAVVVLKGAQSLVGRSATGRIEVYENDTGNSGLGSGGSGDVLAGVIGAFLARGLDAFEAACLAVHVHGAAGDLVAARLSEAGLCADDLPLAVAEVLGR